MKLSFAVVIFLASTLKLKIKVFYGFYQTMASHYHVSLKIWN